MKLAAVYTVWNGIELLQKSIDQIQNDVEAIYLIWQRFSNRGEDHPEILEKLAEIEAKAPIRLVEFTPNFQVNTKQNELHKHNLGLTRVRRDGFTHFVLMACDHYYEPKQFRKAKRLIESEDYQVTFSKMFTYYKRPEWRIDPIENYVMPFIMKICPVSVFKMQPKYAQVCDPSVKIWPSYPWYLFDEDELMMHHYSMIRKDIENKFNNAAASIRWTPEKIQGFKDEYNSAKVGDSIKYFKNRKIISVKNLFDI